jgi:hypothetical protein
MDLINLVTSNDAVEKVTQILCLRLHINIHILLEHKIGLKGGANTEFVN